MQSLLGISPEMVWLGPVIGLFSVISFKCFVALAKNSSTILNQYAKSRHAGLAPDFSGSTLSFSPFRTLL